jgi:hypothetical protein
MVCHESVESYYTNNFSILFHPNHNFKVSNNFTLDDLENMLPYEREIYLSMAQNLIKEIEAK